MATDADSGRSIALPAKVVVSLRAGFVLALANIVCVSILAYAWTKAKSPTKSIQVTGSAKKVIVSDMIVWSGTVSNSDPDLAKSYEKLKTSVDRTLAYLKAKGIPNAQVTLSSISTAKHFKRDDKGNETDTITQYELQQGITVSSSDVEKVADVARSVTEIIKEGVLIESRAPRYLYTKLADLKIEMLAEATKDAANRAEKIATNSGSHLGSVVDARMGVMQINARHEDTVTSYGVNDTSTLEKEITAVVTASFSIE